jgi:LysR family glycine cleavage system transcriptional activator
MRDLPPLHTLPAFEAPARLGSFLAATEALHLTPSAISHRIRQLEAHLGVGL